jgi:hypothetical protein
MCRIKPSPKGKCLIEWLIKELKVSKAKPSKQKCGTTYNLKGEHITGVPIYSKICIFKYILYYFGSSFSLISYNILINM